MKLSDFLGKANPSDDDSESLKKWKWGILMSKKKQIFYPPKKRRKNKFGNMLNHL